jgi:regulator of sigma E protease
MAPKIALGLFGLGIVVFVHELGHFIAARLVGIDVEAFSIGWGNPILKKKIGPVEYRLGMFPIGGYCKMKGEADFSLGLNQQEAGGQPPPPEKGSFFSASPWRRIIVSFLGPFFNFIFAVLVFSSLWGIGFEIAALENRIVLVSDIVPGSTYPADEGGLRTGDRIIEIKGRKIENYHDIQENIATNPEALLPIKVEREGRIIELSLRPSLEKSTGAGRIGIYNWTEPVISRVVEGSLAEGAGLQKGDRILKVNGIDFLYTVALIRLLEERPENLSVEYERDARIMGTEINLGAAENGLTESPPGSPTVFPPDIGIRWETITSHTPRLNPLSALVKGTGQTWKTFIISAKSLSLLFRGIDLTQAVSGPIRITYMMGEVAAEGFGQSFGLGITSMANFLALISIALCIMNLLPLPVLDGGMIILHTVEAIRRKPPPPRAVYVFQTVGVVIIFSLMIFAVFGDILFFVRR